jgi:hypothetical protein
MNLTLQQKLECPFPASRVSWRIGRKTADKKKAQLLAYIDARDVMERLDKACGFENWQCRYNLADNGLLVCEIGIRINSEWIWKANGAGDTQVEAEKGYLYDLEAPWVAIDSYGKWTQDPAIPEQHTPRGYLATLETKQ